MSRIAKEKKTTGRRTAAKKAASAERVVPPTFNLVNLGCPKNLVDSERIMGAMAVDGFVYQEDAAEADVCLVNTCGFLEASRKEAQGIFEELKALRGKNKTPKIVAMGCMVERVGGNPLMGDLLADADAAVGFADYHRLPDICRELCGDGAEKLSVPRGYGGRTLPDSYVRWLNGPSWRFSSPVTAWLKLGEGCSNHCAYCSIPLIRGERVSRPESDVLREARQLAESGVKEICLCAQDTTAYGSDWGGKGHFEALLGKLLELGGDVWWRVLYAHPMHLTKELLKLMASSDRVCPYIDLPLQHVDSGVLGAMQRGYQFEQARRRLAWIRDIMPEGAALRTTFIVGHPGEGEAEFERLMDFVQEGRFDHVGVFEWSAEPGTRSARLELETASPAVAARRAKRLMRAQAHVSHEKWKARLGMVTPVFLEAPVPKRHATWRGHTLWQAPDGIDGECLVNGYPADAAPTVVTAKIGKVDPYGCVADVVD